MNFHLVWETNFLWLFLAPQLQSMKILYGHWIGEDSWGCEGRMNFLFSPKSSIFVPEVAVAIQSQNRKNIL